MQEIRGDWTRVLYGIPCNNSVFKEIKKVNGNEKNSYFTTNKKSAFLYALLVNR